MPDVTNDLSTDRLRMLPSVAELLSTPEALMVAKDTGRDRAVTLAQRAVALLRDELRESGGNDDWLTARRDLLARAAARLKDEWAAERLSGLGRVINASGVIIHTNLGRAPLSEKAVEALARNAGGYCSLEYDISTGKRGRRGGRAEDLLCQLTGAEAAAIVNNCAAAAFLVLTALTRGREVIISRGELVEIGGDFRIPDVLEQSGAELREVGTTNRTKISDYAKAVSDRTGMILRVHPSNYRIIGFTEMPATAAIAGLSREKGIVFYEDAGSGALIDLSEFGLGDEPVIARSIRDGVDIVTFSGDKLLGGPQAGLIVGRATLIELVRKHPLYRALRAGKLVYGALEATLESYARDKAFEEIPVLKMIAADQAMLDARVRAFADRLKAQSAGAADLDITIVDGNSVIGGGSAPGVQPGSSLLAIASKGISAAEIERRLRAFDPPVIARIEAGQVLIDLRTVDESDEDLLLKAIIAVNTGTDAPPMQHADSLERA